MRTLTAVASLALLALAACQRAPGRAAHAEEPKMSTATDTDRDRVVKTDEEWKKLLTPDQYKVLRKKGTERAFTGALWNNHGDGTYVCAADGNLLFDANDKFESGTGWPSFTRPANEKSVVTEEDSSFFMTRTEVLCRRCGGHLGHVFDDGPAPTHKRYCMNSAAMKFVARGK